MPVRNYTRIARDTTAPKIKYEYDVILYKHNEKGEDEVIEFLPQHDYTDKEPFTKKQKFSYILSLLEQDDDYEKHNKASKISINEVKIMTKKVTKEYVLEYECFKSGYTEEFIYAIKCGEATIKYIGDSIDEECKIKWGEKNWDDEKLDKEISEDWRYCEYNDDVFVPCGEPLLQLGEEIDTYNLDENEDEENEIIWK